MCDRSLFISFISLLVFISSAFAAPLISDADLVVYYDFDSVGATVLDGSGNGNDANVVGNVSGHNLGRSGADVVFGGNAAATDLLRFTAAPADRPSSAVTVAAWCKIADVEGDMSVFNVNGARSTDPLQVANLYHMELHPGTGKERIRWCVRNQAQGTIGTFYYNPPDGVITEEWFHFACTYDKNATDGQHLKMYINGEFVAGLAADPAVTDWNIGTGWEYGAALGCTANNARPFDGQMDEFYLFKRALTPAEISMLASASWLVNGGFETGDLTGWFPWNGSVSEVIAAPASIGQGDYSAQMTGLSVSSGLAQIVAIPAGTVVQVDVLWSGACNVGNYWAEVKVLTHAPGAAYNLDESYGDWKYVAKSDAWGLNTKPGGTWAWENGVTGSPLHGNTIISQGEIIVTTKIGGASGNIMAVDNVAVTPLYSIVKASRPIPGDTGTVRVVDFDEITLSWDAGSLAASHDVYFGTDFDSVNDATTASAEFMGNQIANTYTPTIAAEGTYFWRIDEVNDVDIWKGDVWSFEVGIIPPPEINDPIVWYPFEEGAGDVTADISGNGNDANLSATNKWNTQGFDGSGCLTNAQAWGSFYGEVPASAFAEMDQAATISFWFYTEPICEMYGFGGFLRANKGTTGVFAASIYDALAWDGNPVWNYDSYVENYNASAHYIVSHMGTPAVGSGTTQWWYGYNAFAVNQLEQWHHLTFTKDCESLVQKVFFDGLEVANYACDPTHTMDGITAFRFFNRSTTTNDWWDPYHGRMDDFRIYDRALSAEDVKLFVGDRFKPAWSPTPADGAEDLPLDALTLSWQPGQKAVSHLVYFGDDRIEVKNADVTSACYQGEQTGTTLDVGALSLMKTYYWRVDEVDDEGTVWKGDVWSFSSIPSIIVEDFESYDEEGNDVTAVWVDALDYSDMQRLLATEPGYPVLSPVNSLRLRYHALMWSPASYYTIAGRTFSPAQDWTEGGVKMLTINYYGDAGNQGLPMFVTIGDGTTDANVVVDVNTLAESWNEINVSLPEIAAAGVDLTKVSYMEIGFGDGTDQGMSSGQYDIIYIDDIALYPPKCVLSESTLQGDITGDCVVNYDDLDALAFNWLLSGYTVTAASSVSNDGLVLRYEFENNTTDSVAGNNGTLQNLGAAANYGTGHTGTGKCIHFNANSSTSGSNMIVPPAAFADVNEEVTFSFWLKNDTAAPEWYQNTFGGRDIAGDRSHLFMHYSPAYMGNMVSVFHAGSGGNAGWSQWDAVTFTQPETFDYTAWNHFALVKNCFNGEIWYYTNGELMAYARGEINKMYGCDEFKLGSLYGDSSFYQGSFDDFRVYNRALSHAEVLNLAGQASATVELSKFKATASDLNDDEAIDFKDYAILANEWLIEDLWP